MTSLIREKFFLPIEPREGCLDRTVTSVDSGSRLTFV